MSAPRPALPPIDETVLGRSLRYLPLRATSTDGVSVAIQDWAADGQPRAADLLFVHGFSQSHRAWFHQVSAPLARQFRLVTYDLRGHGDSDKPADAPSYREPGRWAAELDAVMAASQLRKPVLVAWSYGGRIVLDYLTRYGDAGISGLVMVNATATTAPEVLGPAIGVLRQMTSTDAAIARQGTLELLRACQAREPSPPELEYMLGYNEQVPALIRAHLAGRPADYAQVLRSLRVPAMVIHGMLDPINNPAMATYTAEQVRHARVLTYADAAHMPFWESPGRFNEDLEQFVRGSVLAGQPS